MFATDAAVFLLDDGVATSWTPSTGGPAVTGLMLFDRPDQDIGEAASREYEVTFVTTSWPGLARGETLVIDGASYALRFTPRQVDDGVFSSARVTKVS